VTREFGTEAPVQTRHSGAERGKQHVSVDAVAEAVEEIDRHLGESAELLTSS
jgi:hypothetical protein